MQTSKARQTLFPAIANAMVRGNRPSLPALRGHPAAPIVLLHGFGTSSRVLAPLARHLRRELRRPVLRMRLGGRVPLHLGDVRKTARRVQSEIEHLAGEQGFAHVDVVGHSLGGLVATYYLKALDRGHRVRKVVTLGTPHHGTPAAVVGALLFGAFSRAVWQMIPGSPLLRELRELPVPRGAELVTLDSDADSVVPPRFARLAPAPGHCSLAVRGLGHVELLVSPLALRAVETALAA
jgi:triacylglycerol esterase/lipase EstA (alpha/beta hydrolase family)